MTWLMIFAGLFIATVMIVKSIFNIKWNCEMEIMSKEERKKKGWLVIIVNGKRIL